jgi:hypothetical protein
MIDSHWFCRRAVRASPFKFQDFAQRVPVTDQEPDGGSRERIDDGAAVGFRVRGWCSAFFGRPRRQLDRFDAVRALRQKSVSSRVSNNPTHVAFGNLAAIKKHAAFGPTRFQVLIAQLKPQALTKSSVWIRVTWMVQLPVEASERHRHAAHRHHAGGAHDSRRAYERSSHANDKAAPRQLVSVVGKQ